MASIDLGRLVTESLTRFGANAESVEPAEIDLADVFEMTISKKEWEDRAAEREAAAKKGRQARSSGEYNTILNKSKNAATGAAKSIAGGVKGVASKVANGSISGAVGSAKAGLGKAKDHVAAHKGKYAAGGLALAGMGALAYRYLKNKKKKQAQAAQ